MGSLTSRPKIPTPAPVAVAPPPPPPAPPPVPEPEPVAPIADDQQVANSKKKSFAQRVATQGRQSTIKTTGEDTLG